MPAITLGAHQQNRGGRLRLSHFIALAMVSIILMFAFGVLGVIWSSRNPQPQTTLADLTAAEGNWRRHGPASYDLELDKVGARDDHIEVRVRDGQAIFFAVNGRQPEQRRLWDTWTVPSQFEYIRADLAREIPTENTPPLIRAQFDPRTGIPWNYTYSGAGGFQSGWKIQRFTANP